MKRSNKFEHLGIKLVTFSNLSVKFGTLKIPRWISKNNFKRYQKFEFQALKNMSSTPNILPCRLLSHRA